MMPHSIATDSILTCTWVSDTSNACSKMSGYVLLQKQIVVLTTEWLVADKLKRDCSVLLIA